jgi:hypothetical protein
MHRGSASQKKINLYCHCIDIGLKVKKWLKTGQIAITQAKHPAAYALAGLAYDTKFDFKAIIELPWSDRYFKVPLGNRHGNTPKIGTLHATVIRAVEAAYHAAVSR